eukprot:scaffold54405_cov55-Phaeocystis_antarctica.AAC.10
MAYFATLYNMLSSGSPPSSRGATYPASARPTAWSTLATRGRRSPPRRCPAARRRPIYRDSIGERARWGPSGRRGRDKAARRRRCPIRRSTGAGSGRCVPTSRRHPLRMRGRWHATVSRQGPRRASASVTDP